MYSTDTLKRICFNAAISARNNRGLVSSENPRYKASLIAEIFFSSLADALNYVDEEPDKKVNKGVKRN